MPESYTGEIRNGVVIFEGTPPALPPGTRVRIEPIAEEAEQTPTLADRLRPVIGMVKDMPSDMAEQHDHYSHGQPKR